MKEPFLNKIKFGKENIEYMPISTIKDKWLAIPRKDNIMIFSYKELLDAFLKDLEYYYRFFRNDIYVEKIETLESLKKLEEEVIEKDFLPKPLFLVVDFDILRNKQGIGLFANLQRRNITFIVLFDVHKKYKNTDPSCKEEALYHELGSSIPAIRINLTHEYGSNLRKVVFLNRYG